MKRRTIGSLLVAGSLVSTLGLVGEGSAANLETDPIVARGLLPDRYDLEDVAVEVLPVIKPGGPTANLVTKPVSPSDLTLENGELVVRLDPTALGASHLSPEGRADIKIFAADGETAWGTSLTAQAVSVSASDPEWVDPGDASALSAPTTAKLSGSRVAVVSRKVATSLPTPEFAGPDGGAAARAADPVSSRAIALDGTGGFDDDDGEWDGGVTTPRTSACPDGGSGPHQVTKTGEATWWSTIGTSYPVGDSTATMRVATNSKNGANYGAALGYSGAGFKAAGKRWAAGGWSKTWVDGGNARSYRKQVLYYRYRYSGYINPACNHNHWVAIKETGGTAINRDGVTRPSWNKYCVPESPGPWSRDDGRGHSYTYGAAVKSGDTIGLDLGIDREYSSTQVLTYNIRGKGKQLCGNNDYPSVAGKIMERRKP